MTHVMPFFNAIHVLKMTTCRKAVEKIPEALYDVVVERRTAMKIEIKLDENAPERKVIIVTDAVDEEIQELMRRIGQERPQVLAGFSGDQVVLLDQKEIVRVYADRGKVYAVTDSGRIDSSPAAV